MKTRPRIIIPIQPRSLAAAKKDMRAAEKVGDVVELWLDGLPELNDLIVRELVVFARKPLMLNLKDAVEKGRFTGSMTDRLALLAAGAAVATKRNQIFIDLPLSCPAAQIRAFKAQHKKVGLIVSCHDFSAMPTVAQLRRHAAKARAAGADIVKLVGTAKTIADNYVILQITQELVSARQDCLTMAMGEIGQMTRVITPLMGGWGMFAARNIKTASAAGQLTAAELKKLWQKMS